MLRATLKQFQVVLRRQCLLQQLRLASTHEGRPRPRRRVPNKPPALRAARQKSEWWIIDGEMHEIGDNVPVRERFIIPRDNLPNRRRKQLRSQFMNRTRLSLQPNEHEPFCKRYMELYNELRENWERLYWDEGYSKKLAVDHANYDSPDEDNDEDFSPYRRRRSDSGPHQQQAETFDKVNQLRDKFEYDREKRMREKAFAPMNPRIASDDRRSTFKNRPFGEQKFPSGDEDN